LLLVGVLIWIAISVDSARDLQYRSIIVKSEVLQVRKGLGIWAT
jgi:hypothetical protein